MFAYSDYSATAYQNYNDALSLIKENLVEDSHHDVMVGAIDVANHNAELWQKRINPVGGGNPQERNDPCLSEAIYSDILAVPGCAFSGDIQNFAECVGGTSVLTYIKCAKDDEG